MSEEIATKSEFATIVGVSAARVSQYIGKGQIHGDALVGTGHRARIRVAVAKEQLNRNLDVSQHLGLKGRARTDGNGTPPDSVEQSIKAARLEQLTLANEQARAVRAAAAGRYILTDDVRREMGTLTSRILSNVEGGLAELANLIAANSNLSARDALHILRTGFVTVRDRAAKAERKAASALPPLVGGNSEASP